MTIGIALLFLLAACAAPSAEDGTTSNVTDGDGGTTEPTTIPTEQATEAPASEADGTATLLPEEAPPAGAEAQFDTDFSKHSVPYSEILSGGPPKDGIPAIDNPTFVSVEEADEWLEAREPVIEFVLGDDARAYPLQILTWHEIANDTVNDRPVTVTFCPLCNTAIAFDATHKGQALDFGTTGRLRFSNLIMYDRQTETWWQQATGEAIAGKFTGDQLEFLPATIISWGDFKEKHPDGQVLSRDTGFNRNYGQNPYAGYDDIDSRPFLYDGPTVGGELKAMARVLTVDLGDDPVAYPYEVLQEEHVVNDEVAGEPIAVFWEAGTASALNTGEIASGRDVGAAAAYLRTLDGQTLTFTVEDGSIVDEQTGSEWNVLGEAVSGELAGAQLEEVVSINHFWFSWAAFKPETRVYSPASS